MIWDSWSDLIDMGGYALYVWGSFAVVALAVGAEQATLALRRRNARRLALRAAGGRL
jgi:heme exporter protein D